MTNKRVAIVEDDLALILGLKEVFKLFEYDTLLITDGAGAFEQLKVFRPGVVILDLRLPHWPGLEILQAIRADAQLSRTKVVVLTAYEEAGKVAAPMADEVLIKSADVDGLMALVARLGDG